MMVKIIATLCHHSQRTNDIIKLQRKLKWQNENKNKTKISNQKQHVAFCQEFQVWVSKSSEKEREADREKLASYFNAHQWMHVPQFIQEALEGCPA